MSLDKNFWADPPAAPAPEPEKKRIGFRFIGGDGGPGTTFESVYELTPEEQQYQATLSTLLKEREALAAALKQKDEEWKRHREQCTHRVMRDEAGWMYDERSCVICGAHLETL